MIEAHEAGAGEAHKPLQALYYGRGILSPGVSEENWWEEWNYCPVVISEDTVFY